MLMPKRGNGGDTGEKRSLDGSGWKGREWDREKRKVRGGERDMQGDSGTDTKERVKDGQTIGECTRLTEGKEEAVGLGIKLVSEII